MLIERQFDLFFQPVRIHRINLFFDQNRFTLLNCHFINTHFDQTAIAVRINVVIVVNKCYMTNLFVVKQHFEQATIEPLFQLVRINITKGCFDQNGFTLFFRQTKNCWSNSYLTSIPTSLSQRDYCFDQNVVSWLNCFWSHNILSKQQFNLDSNCFESPWLSGCLIEMKLHVHLMLIKQTFWSNNASTLIETSSNQHD